MHKNRFQEPTYAGTWVVLAAFATALSLMRTGFAFGISNNVFHIPLALGWEHLPAFAGDTYYLSLRKFTSLVWPLIALASNDSNVETVFLIAHILSRGFAMAAIAAFLSLQLRLRPGEALLTMITVALTPWLVGGSVIGAHGLWIEYFSHSEVTWGFLLLSLMAAHAQRWTWAAALAGLVFDVNAFVGIWLLFMLGLAYCVLPPSQAWKQLLKSAVAFLLCAAPAAIWIAQSLGESHAAFSFLEYIRAYFPAHFLIEASNWRTRAIFIVLTILGFTAALLMPSPKFWLAVLTAAVIVFLIGTVLPYWLDHRLVFNLHLLRIGGVVQWLTLLMAVISLASRLTSGQRCRVSTYAMVGLLSLMTHQAEPASLIVAWVCLAAITLIEHRPENDRLITMLCKPGVVIGWIVLVITMEALRYEPSWANALRWTAMLAMVWSSPVRWARWGVLLLGTAILAPQIHSRGQLIREAPIPRSVIDLANWIRTEGIQGPILAEINPGLDYLQLLTRQPVWVDKKQGAAVMWEPSFHSRWMTRYRDVLQLKGTAQFLAYARQHHLKYIVTHINQGSCAKGSTQLFHNQDYLVCQVS